MSEKNTNMHKEYLRDSVYVESSYGEMRLTTDNGCGPSNTIVLEPEVLAALNRYAEMIRAIQTEQSKLDQLRTQQEAPIVHE